MIVSVMGRENYKVDTLIFDGFLVRKNKDYKLHDFLIENKHLTPLEHICKAINVEDSNISINVGGYDYTLPSSLLGTLSFQTSKYFTWEMIWTRQYKGFYTYRHMLEDNNSIYDY